MKTTPEATIRPKHDIRRLGAVIGFATPALLLVTTTITAVFTPGYNPIDFSLSRLVLGPLGWLQSTGFILIGLMQLFYATALFSAIPGSPRSRAAHAIFLLFGVGAVMDGIFPTGISSGPAATVTARIHVSIGLGAAYALPVVCFLLAGVFRASRDWHGLWVYTLANGLAAAGVVIWRLFLPAVLPWFGAYEAILVLLGFVWMEFLTVRLWQVSATPVAAASGRAAASPSAP